MTGSVTVLVPNRTTGPFIVEDDLDTFVCAVLSILEPDDMRGNEEIVLLADGIFLLVPEPSALVLGFRF